MNRLAGPFAWLYWLTLALNVLPLELMWWPRLRRSTPVLAVVAVCVIVGMWCERAMLLVTSLSRSALPSSAGGYVPTAWRSEEHTSELQSLMRISYAVFCLKKKNKKKTIV